MNSKAPKRNKGNRHPTHSFAPKFRRIKESPRQRIRQLLRASIPLSEVQTYDEEVDKIG